MSARTISEERINFPDLAPEYDARNQAVAVMKDAHARHGRGQALVKDRGVEITGLAAGAISPSVSEESATMEGNSRLSTAASIRQNFFAYGEDDRTESGFSQKGDGEMSGPYGSRAIVDGFIEPRLARRFHETVADRRSSAIARPERIRRNDREIGGGGIREASPSRVRRLRRNEISTGRERRRPREHFASPAPSLPTSCRRFTLIAALPSSVAPVSLAQRRRHEVKGNSSDLGLSGWCECRNARVADIARSTFGVHEFTRREETIADLFRRFSKETTEQCGRNRYW